MTPDDQPNPPPSITRAFGRIVHGDQWDAVDDERRAEAVRAARKRCFDAIIGYVLAVAVVTAAVLTLAALVVAAWRWAL